ncbi:MAG: ABC transporter ATP-binding protein [Pseudonocardia sp.]
MISARGLIKRYSEVLAVDGLSFDVTPGAVTGFLGPNGSGKSTTMRMILGLDAPTSGSVTVNGHPYRELVAPAREIGALLDPRCMHPGRTARAHLRWMADAAGIGRRRVEEVLELVGVAAAADRRVDTFSLGMRQRLGIAGALWVSPACCYSTSRSTAWIPRASAGSDRCCASLPPGAARCSSPAI